MTRINTNVTSLAAQQTLISSNANLEQTLTRLSTGLRINSGKDDPAGLIAANSLANDIKSSQQAIANSQVANQMISTADSALSQISSLLTTVKGLVNQASNTAALSGSQIAANQLQIDSSLDAINRISQTTTFQGQKLLDGSLGFIVEKDTNFGKVTNLQVNQANFGTASSVAVDISVSTLATQAAAGATINDGVASNAKATAKITFSGGASSITIQAPSTGTSSNGMRVKFTESSTIGAGNASAAFDSTTQTMNITVSNTGTTTAATIGAAISSGTDFTVTNTTGIGGYAVGADTATLATDTVTTADSGSMTLTSLIPGANTATVTFVLGDATAGPTVAVDATTNNMTITVNDNTHGGSTSLASIATAINNFKDSVGRQVYSANVTAAGSYNTTVSATTRLSPDGPSGTPAKVDSATSVSVGTGGVTVNFKALGAAAGAARIVISKTVGAESAVWDATANGGLGQLSIALSTTGGTGGAGSVGDYLAADIATLVNAATGGTPFETMVAGDVSAHIDAGDIAVMPDGVAYQADIVSGSDGWLHATNGTFAGGGTGGQFGVGAGTTAGTGVSGLAADITLQIGGNYGSQLVSFGRGTTTAQIVTALNQISDSTGVVASTEGDQLKLQSTDYGKAAFVNIKVITEGTGGTFGSTLTATHAAGTDIVATVNSLAATGTANIVSINTSTLAFSASLDATQVAVGDDIKFNLTGGGALFQLGPDVQGSQQARMGIQSVDTGSLGGTVGRLYQLASGQNAALLTNTKLASKIVSAATDAVSSLRGRLGAFQKATVDTNIASLTSTVVNLTAAQSSIQDADFAAESSNLTRAQILVQSGTAVLGIANKNPENVLSLLR